LALILSKAINTGSPQLDTAPPLVLRMPLLELHMPLTLVPHRWLLLHTRRAPLALLNAPHAHSSLLVLAGSMEPLALPLEPHCKRASA